MKIKVIAISLVAIAPMVACAWDSPGHKTIAAIAWTQLNAKARSRIAQILANGDPSFAPTDNSDEAVRTSFMLAATFPDDIKNDHNTIYESSISYWNNYFLGSVPPATSGGKGGRCELWHYYDTPLFYRGQRPPDKPSNALKAFPLAVQGLVSSKDDRERCWWLYWVEHLTGDLHQPLHCASSYALSPRGDHGGNSYPIRASESELHAYWDAGIDHATKDDDELEAAVTTWTKNMPLASVPEANDLNPADWVADGARLAATVVYAGIAPNTAPSPQYLARQKDLCKRLAVVAGYRLATILNNTFGS